MSLLIAGLMSHKLNSSLLSTQSVPRTKFQDKACVFLLVPTLKKNNKKTGLIFSPKRLLVIRG